MKIWKSGDRELRKVIYQLEHQYSQANLNASALKGSDSSVFALVDTVAKELGFCLGLAHLELRLSGYARDHGGDGYYDGWGRYQCTYDNRGDEKVEFAEVESRTVTVENLVDAEGKAISSEIKFSDKKEAIPKGFIAELEHDAHDGQEYEGYMGNVCPSSFIELTVPNLLLLQGAGSLERCMSLIQPLIELHANPLASLSANSTCIVATFNAPRKRGRKPESCASFQRSSARRRWHADGRRTRIIRLCMPGSAKSPERSNVKHTELRRTGMERPGEVDESSSRFQREQSL
jgi:hypothetical protein